ncbi:MAG: ribonuclease HII [Alphaproteobacteria bacterium]|nr:ribonuclease HII [Alphaproteobacteria bacterium]
MPTFDFEDRIRASSPKAVIAGIDEAGRGPWAGPVIAAAAILDPAALPKSLREGLDDSKALSPTLRDALYSEIEKSSAVAFGWGQADVEEIDRLNILSANDLAMSRALEALGRPVDHALVDGNRRPPLNCAVTAVVCGDALSLSIAAASIVAKVTRDRIMSKLAAEFPVYGWHTNKGYGTVDHRNALQLYGVTPHHRRSFAPVRERLARG